MVRVGKTGKAACTLRGIYKASGVSSFGSSRRIFSSSTQQIKILTFQHYRYFILLNTTVCTSASTELTTAGEQRPTARSADSAPPIRRGQLGAAN